jgi:hypothetical protein
MGAVKLAATATDTSAAWAAPSQNRIQQRTPAFHVDTPLFMNGIAKL